MGGHVQQLRTDAPRAGVVVLVALSLWALAVYSPAPARAMGRLPQQPGQAASSNLSTLSVDGSKPVLRRDDNAAATAQLTAAATGAVVKKTKQKGAPGTTPSRPDGLVAGSPAIDPVVLAAHQRSAATMARTEPGCHLNWSLLAGIGQVESGNAHSTRVAPNGDTHPSILGPVLDSSGGFAAIADTDHGRYDGNASWDRAVGPMQFIPSSWRRWARDGNGDGRRDPSNVFDASLGSAGYLCQGHDLAVPGQLGQAVYSYNHSWDYVRSVLAWTIAFRTGHLILPAGPGPSPTPTAQPSPSPHTAAASPRPRPAPRRSPSPLVTPSRTPGPSPSPSPPGSPTPTPSVTASPAPSGSGPPPDPSPTPTP